MWFEPLMLLFRYFDMCLHLNLFYCHGVGYLHVNIVCFLMICMFLSILSEDGLPVLLPHEVARDSQGVEAHHCLQPDASRYHGGGYWRGGAVQGKDQRQVVQVQWQDDSACDGQLPGQVCHGEHVARVAERCAGRAL